MPPFGADGRTVRLNHSTDLEIHGRLSLTVLNELGEVEDHRDGDNVVCTTGFTALAAALVWAGIQDQATSLGATTPTYLTPLYGAVGSGAGVPVKSDVQLFSELSRQVVGGGGSTPATSAIAAAAAWLFFFPNPPVPWTVTEAGVFANASPNVNDGDLLDHWAFSPSVSVLTANTLVLQVSLAIGP